MLSRSAQRDLQRMDEQPKTDQWQQAVATREATRKEHCFRLQRLPRLLGSILLQDQFSRDKRK